MNGKKKNMIFDLGAVILDWNPRYLFKPYFNDDEKCEHFLAEICDYRWNCKHDKDTFWGNSVDELSRKYPEWSEAIHLYHTGWVKMMKDQIPGMQEIITELKAAGYRIYALSNWSCETFYLIRNNYPVMDLFDGLVISGDIGMLKPEKGIYDYLFKKFDLSADECLFTDDNADNVRGAIDAGIDTIHFTDAEAYKAELINRGIL